MTIQFHSWPRSSGTRVHWVLEELGVPYELIKPDGAKKEQKSAAYLAINPNGKVPGLVDDGVTFFESLAMLLHLGEKYGVEKGLWPKDGQARADAMSWATWAHTELWAYVIQYVYHGLDAPMSYKPEDRSVPAAAWSLSNFNAHMDMLEKRLADRDCILGDFSLVDVAPATIVGFAKALGAPMGDRPKTADWLKRCNARPARKRAA